MATSTDLRAAIDEVRERYSPGDAALPGEVRGGVGDLADELERRAGATPWWVISVVVHAVLFLLAGLLTVAATRPVCDDSPLVFDVKPEKPVRYVERRPGVFTTDIEIKHPDKVREPILLHEPAELAERFESANDSDSRSARGQEKAISDIPLSEKGVTGVLGVGGGRMAGAFGYRGPGGRRHAVKEFGGSRLTESAVKRALAWLARHQEADGHWDAKKYEGSMKTDAGITGLALLAFLGAGHTEKGGEHREVVRKAARWIMKSQAADGAIGRGSEGTEPNGVGYHHAICGLALAEAYGMAGDAGVRSAAQKAVDYSVKSHQIKGSGWRYVPGQAGGADLSVTGWFVMQMKSARIAKLNVPPGALQGALIFTDKVSDQYGKCRYKADWLSPNPTMTSVGMLVRLYTGSRPGDAKVSGGANYLLKNLPVWGENGVGANMYYWYYGAMTMFQVRGRPWKKWNAAMTGALVPNQRTGGPTDGTKEDVKGSWDPVGAWATRGGRVYATAVGALCLEVYYRYLPIYGGK